MRRTRIGLLALLVTLLVTGLTVPVVALDVGDKAPDFTLPATIRDSWSLKEALGKKNVVLFGFIGAFTPT